MELYGDQRSCFLGAVPEKTSSEKATLARSNALLALGRVDVEIIAVVTHPKDAVAAIRIKGLEKTALDAVNSDGPVGWVGKREAGVGLEKVLKSNNFFALARRHDDLREVGIPE
jgi:hypothetical protein